MKTDPADAANNGVSLTESQLAAAAGLERVDIRPLSPLAGLRLPLQPLTALAGSAALDAGGQRLKPALAAALGVMAAPERLISCVSIVAKEPGCWRTVVCQSAATTGEAFCSFERAPDNRCVVQPLPDRQAAMDQLGALLRPLNPATGAGSTPEMKLTQDGYMALLACADVWQASALRVRLARAEPVRPVVTVAALEKALRDGLAHPTRGWVVAACQEVDPDSLAQAADRLALGMEDLVSAKLARSVTRGFGLTEAGERAVAVLAEFIRICHLTVRFPSPSQPSVAAEITVFLAHTGSWLAWRSTDTKGETRIGLQPLTVTTVANFTRSLFELAPSPATAQAADAAKPPKRKSTKEAKTRECPKCQASLAADARFCSECGLDLNAKPPPVRTCSNPACGAPIPPGRKFCTRCGTQAAA